MELPPDAKSGDLFLPPPPPSRPLPPALMDAFISHLRLFDGLPRSHAQRGEFLLKSAAMMGDLYPAHLSTDKHYQPLRPLIEAFRHDQQEMREHHTGPERHMSRPQFQERLENLAARLENAAAHMEWQSRHQALQEAEARDAAAGSASPAFFFPHVTRLALRTPKPDEDFHKNLRTAYRHDWEVIENARPASADDPRRQHCSSLDIVHMARWANAARLLAKRINHYQISLGNPDTHWEGHMPASRAERLLVERDQRRGR